MTTDTPTKTPHYFHKTLIYNHYTRVEMLYGRLWHGKFSE